MIVLKDGKRMLLLCSIYKLNSGAKPHIKKRTFLCKTQITQRSTDIGHRKAKTQPLISFLKPP
uniref:Uncharacterized protein n=1 Tax=Oryza brachyantha TaxID=4533 RepID=J3MXT2_ORYBR